MPIHRADGSVVNDQTGLPPSPELGPLPPIFVPEPVQGPAGPTGPDGPPGATGPTGPAGGFSSPGTLNLLPFSTTTPNVIVWRRAVSTDVDAAFAISGFSLNTPTVLVGSAVSNPSFIASYTSAPDSTANSVVVTNPDFPSPVDVSGTPTAFTITGGPVTKSSVGATTAFLLTAKQGTNTQTRTANLTWINYVIWGLLVSPAATQGNLDSLRTQHNALSNSRDGSFAFTSGSGFPCVAIRTALGAPASWQIGPTVQTLDTIGTVSWSNGAATPFSENYTLFAMSSTGLGVFTLQAIG